MILNKIKHLFNETFKSHKQKGEMITIQLLSVNNFLKDQLQDTIKDTYKYNVHTKTVTYKDR